MKDDRPVLFCDVDGVCADLETEWLYRYNRDYHDNLDPQSITSWDMAAYVKPECGAAIYDYLNAPDLYEAVQPIQDALHGINWIRRWNIRVVFATSSTNGSAGAKYRWLVRHRFLPKSPFTGGQSKDYIEISDKSLLRGKIMIDDGFHNIVDFSGLGILFTAAHNKNQYWPNRANNWEEVIQFLERIYGKRLRDIQDAQAEVEHGS